MITKFTVEIHTDRPPTSDENEEIKWAIREKLKDLEHNNKLKPTIRYAFLSEEGRS